MQRDFNEFAVDIKISGLSEFEQVYANIAKEGILRMNSVDEWKNKFANATAEAQQLYERAMKTGDANVIANALAMLEERKAAEITAAEEAKNAKAIIEKEYTEEIMSQATLAQAYKAELDEASKQGIWSDILLIWMKKKLHSSKVRQKNKRQCNFIKIGEWRRKKALHHFL